MSNKCTLDTNSSTQYNKKDEEKKLTQFTANKEKRVFSTEKFNDESAKFFQQREKIFKAFDEDLQSLINRKKIKHRTI